MMEDKIFYLIKDVGVPSAMVGFLAYAWYKLGAKLLLTLGKNTQVIESNSKIMEKIIYILDKNTRR